MKSVLITGATRGIGRATAELFLKEGYKVLFIYSQSTKKAKDIDDYEVLCYSRRIIHHTIFYKKRVNLLIFLYTAIKNRQIKCFFVFFKNQFRGTTSPNTGHNAYFIGYDTN